MKARKADSSSGRRKKSNGCSVLTTREYSPDEMDRFGESAEHADEAMTIGALGIYASVQNAYMEEEPLISDWSNLATTPNVVVVPFFISDGLHSYEDIPVLLGIVEERSTSAADRKGEEIFRRGPYKVDNRSLFYASSIGTDPRVADIIVEQATAFESIGSRS